MFRSKFELILCHKLWFFNPFNFENPMYMYMHLLLPTSLNYPVTIRPSTFYAVTNVDWKDICDEIFLNMNSVWYNNLILINQLFTLSGCKKLGIRKFEFVAKTQLIFPMNGQKKNMLLGTKFYFFHLSIFSFVPRSVGECFTSWML